MSREFGNVPRRWLEIGEFTTGNDDYTGRRAAPEVAKNEGTDRRRKIALVAIAVDLANQARQRRVAASGNFPQAIPESRLQAHAGLVTADGN